MNNRVKELRSALGLSQSEFGKKISLRQATVGQIENGTRNLTDRTLNDICREYGVNDEWLRTGSGDMFSRNGNDHMANMILRLLSTYDKDELDTIQRFLESIKGIKK